MSKQEKVKHKIEHIKKIDAVILFVVFVMFIVLIADMWVTTQHYKEEQLYQIQDAMDIISDNQKTQFENYIAEKVTRLQGLATFYEINGMDTERQSRFLKGRSDELGFHHIFIMDMEGNGYYFDEGITRNQKDEPFFENVMNNHIYVTEPFYGQYEAYMTVCVSIFNSAGEKIGALCGAVELNTMRNVFVETRTVVDGEVFMVNRDGVYVAADDMQYVYNQGSIYEDEDSDYSLVSESFEQKQDKTGIIMRDGREYQADITYLKDYDWVIIQCIETDIIYEDLKSIDMWTYFSIVIVLIILLCVARIAIYWSRSERRINTDTLTGCHSRAAMESLIDKLESNRTYQITVTYMDLNKFKLINDNCGHDMGDKVLCIFSRVLMEVFDKKGYVGRMGGDEFMVILLNMQEEQLLECCEQIGALLEEESKKLDIQYVISTSYGYATRAKGSDEPLSSIINMADEKMYQYKEEHRNTNK